MVLCYVCNNCNICKIIRKTFSNYSTTRSFKVFGNTRSTATD